jgi:hypothetical protein
MSIRNYMKNIAFMCLTKPIIEEKRKYCLIKKICTSSKEAQEFLSKFASSA